MADDKERGFHHQPLPSFSTLLSGRQPRDDIGWRSDHLQVWLNDTAEPWVDDAPHRHRESDEMFIVLEGTIVVAIGEETVEVGPGEFCCFPSGLRHQIIETRPPLRTLMLRAPSVEDKEP